MSSRMRYQPVIRLAAPNDVEGIRQVYAPYVDTPTTFEEEVPAPAGFQARMEDVMQFYPCLIVCEESDPTTPAEAVCEDPARVARTEAVSSVSPGASASADRVIGFAYAHRQAERAAYDWNVELSIYLRRGIGRQGIGTALYDALMKLLALQGVRCCYARVTLPNAASERLHARFGFDTMGIQRNAGFKNGAWRDVAWYVKPIGPFDQDPARPAPFPRVMREHASEVERILKQANEAHAGDHFSHAARRREISSA